MIGFMSQVWALSVSRVRIKDRGLAYSVMFSGDWNRSRITAREVRAAGMRTMAAREVISSSTAAMAVPRRVAHPRSPVEWVLVVSEVAEKELRFGVSTT